MDSSSGATSHKRTETFFSCNICLLSAWNPVTTTCGHVYCRPCLSTWLDRRHPGSCPVCRAVVSNDENVISVRLNGSMEAGDQYLPHVPHAGRPEIQAPDTHEGIPATHINVLQDEDDQMLLTSSENYFDLEELTFDDEDIWLDAEAPEVDEDPDLEKLVRLLICG